MSKFYVGQRVRLARPLHPENFGKTGVILSIDSPWLHPEGVISNCTVAFEDGVGDSNTDRLEPLQPERNQTIAWSECVWKPEHMRAEA